MKRIRVPAEMLKAANQAWLNLDPEMLRIVVESVLRYISEETEKLKQKDTTRYNVSEPIHAYDRLSGYNAALDDILKLFSEPEPKDNPVVKGIVDRFRGVTLSRIEADYIIDQINMVTHG